MSSEPLSDILEKIDKARADGATIDCGGDKVRQSGLEKGNFLPPTILTDVTPQMSVPRDELFGPVLSVMVYREPADALAIANDSDYQSEIPFGGYKVSGIGREHGGEAIHEYTQPKASPSDSNDSNLASRSDQAFGTGVWIILAANVFHIPHMRLWLCVMYAGGLIQGCCESDLGWQARHPISGWRLPATGGGTIYQQGSTSARRTWVLTRRRLPTHRVKRRAG